jgi:hypothetical protein
MIGAGGFHPYIQIGIKFATPGGSISIGTKDPGSSIQASVNAAIITAAGGIGSQGGFCEGGLSTPSLGAGLEAVIDLKGILDKFDSGPGPYGCPSHWDLSELALGAHFACPCGSRE